ncbi:MAG TPA: DUF1214 domain-containing protein [Casimicrobiaceae bacterium]|nr:DUF1214 domain-containing protein [Casimicrobiaceae bacterium]
MANDDKLTPVDVADRLLRGHDAFLGCTPGADGLLTLDIQSTSPGADKESNWLPATKSGPFKLALRLYVPKKQVTDGTWKPPAVQRAS